MVSTTPLTVTQAPPPASIARRPCDTLTAISLAGGTITSATAVSAGTFIAPTTGFGAMGASVSTPFSALPAFCRVAATLRPTADSEIKIEVWMPAGAWNGKFQAVGNGGWAGSISYPAMATVLARGYATASTDTGHTGDGGAFVLGRPEKFVDYAYRAVHEMTVQAKAIVAAYYGNGPRLSYWNGCSTGGRQGLIEAQRFPNDYDGVIAGAPANPRTRLSAWHLTQVQATLRDPVTVIPRDKLRVIHQAVVNACDALDGVKDGLINNPTACRFDPTVLACSDGPDCLTRPQAEAVSKLLTPLKHPRTGAEIFPGWEPGSELGWGAIIAGPEPTALTLDHYRFVVFADPRWDWRSFDVERDLARAEAGDKGTIDAINPDLTPFATRGGKLLLYHGWSDPLVPPRASVNYYGSVVKAMGAARSADLVRLFMAPGMGHCSGGEDQLVASTVNDGKVERSRPLCAYPAVATYVGRGSTDEAASFVCRTP